MSLDRLTLAALFLALLLILLLEADSDQEAAAPAPKPTYRLTEENLEAMAGKVKEGLTLKEVERILGGRGVEDRHHPLPPSSPWKKLLWGIGGRTNESIDNVIVVYFEKSVVVRRMLITHRVNIWPPPILLSIPEVPPPPPKQPPKKRPLQLA